MPSLKCEVSRCGLCRFYTPEGRRGGLCSQLSAPVNSQWKACCLAVSPFLEASESRLEDTLAIAKWSSASFATQAAVLPVRKKATAAV